MYHKSEQILFWRRDSLSQRRISLNFGSIQNICSRQYDAKGDAMYDVI